MQRQNHAEAEPCRSRTMQKQNHTEVEQSRSRTMQKQNHIEEEPSRGRTMQRQTHSLYTEPCIPCMGFTLHSKNHPCKHRTMQGQNHPSLQRTMRGHKHATTMHTLDTCPHGTTIHRAMHTLHTEGREGEMQGGGGRVEVSSERIPLLNRAGICVRTSLGLPALPLYEYIFLSLLWVSNPRPFTISHPSISECSRTSEKLTDYSISDTA